MGRILLYLLCSTVTATVMCAQEIEQYEVFAGRYDYLSFGNTMNLQENGSAENCTILTTSSASFQIDPDQSVIAAYLYWAGSGTGDFEILLNDSPITAMRVFSDQTDNQRVFFAAFADVTDILQTTGNGTYVVSDLDLTDVIAPYCSSGTNFAGWAIAVVYEDLGLPFNVITMFDGLESVSATTGELSIQLENLNVLDIEDAKIGFIAWEGDAALAVSETLSINGTILSNPPLNPANNQFNGTNSFTGADNLYNMDIDVYTIENNIAIGDTSAEIVLTSGQDFVMINSVITVLNSQLPDAIVIIDGTENACQSRELFIEYTVSNVGTDNLPAETPVTFYIDNIPYITVGTPNSIAVGASLMLSLSLDIPETFDEIFNLTAVIDDDGSGEGIVIETNEENNNSENITIFLGILPLELPLIPLKSCDIDGNGFEEFDLTIIGNQAIISDSSVMVNYHLLESDAEEGINPIEEPSSFINTTSPQSIYVRFTRMDDDQCLHVESTVIAVISPPEIPSWEGLRQCDDLENDGIVIFDFTYIVEGVSSTQEGVLVSFFETETDAILNQNSILDIDSYENVPGQEMIFVRLSREELADCFEIGELPLVVTAQDTIQSLPNLIACNDGFETAVFDLTEIERYVEPASGAVVGYYTTQENASLMAQPIDNEFTYTNLSNPQEIIMRTDANDGSICPQYLRFNLTVENCPPFVPEGFSPNNDGMNDVFELSGLKDVFPNYLLRIYTRLGNLVYEGSQETEFWSGVSNRGLLGTEVPAGVYYWILTLNDDQIKDLSGWVYLNR